MPKKRIYIDFWGYDLKNITLILLVLTIFGCSQNLTTDNENRDAKVATEGENSKQPFYSYLGEERKTRFAAEYLSQYKTLDQISKLSENQKKRLIEREIDPVIAYLFGPLTHRSIGGLQREKIVTVHWEGAQERNKKIYLPYSVDAVWIIDADEAAKKVLELPLPYNESVILTDGWKKCTDRDPGHQTISFYWYFWDPSRFGCDQKLGLHYQNVKVLIGEETPKTDASYPEYARLLRTTPDGKPLMQMTFAFGYVEDPEYARPYQDVDYGMMEFKKFHVQVRNLLSTLGPYINVVESPILESDYLQAKHPDNRIGTRFQMELNGVVFHINVVAAANVDQMDLFAKSFAHDHEGFFGWFGHSRVGSGFDADRFVGMTMESPDYYSITNEYQIIYWAGCNSYSYYTLPFFDVKNGTKNLDIISNGLPSLFAFNADNATIALQKLLKWEQKPSYQSWVNELERRAQVYGYLVLVNVLGDEDNAL